MTYKNNPASCYFSRHWPRLRDSGIGKIIGGYTPLKWESHQSGQYKEDASGESFLFSVSLNEKYPVTDKQKATWQHKDWGPTLGGGCDLILYDKCKSY